MSDGTPEPVGVRIARARKQRGLTQQGLAQRTTYSRSFIALVEAGHRIATPALVAAIASALRMPASDLYGQPYHLPGPADQIHHAIPDLRRVLAYVGVGPELQGAPRPVSELRTQVRQLRSQLLLARFTRVAEALPAVLEELTHWAYEDDSPATWEVLHRAHAIAVSLTRRLGYGGDSLAWMDRAAESARNSQDPHLPVMTTAPRALLLAEMSQYMPGLQILAQARRDMHPDLPDYGEVSGYLALRAAVVAARAGTQHATQAWDHYEVAVEVIDAGRLGPDVHNVQFNAPNVAIHGAAIAVELGDLDEAARRDLKIDERLLRGLAPERRAHHEIDMARMHVELGDYARATARIAGAEKLAPQMVRFHPSARSVVAHLIDVRRTLPEPLRSLQARMGV